MASAKRTAIVAAIVVGAVLIGVAVVALILDIHDDRQYTAVVTGDVRVYERSAPPENFKSDTGMIDMLHRGDQVQVLRITSETSYKAYRIRLRDGREGYIFFGQDFDLEKR